MKFYFPTSTLNFSNIVSSQRIFPVQYYTEGALWWNNYEKTAAEREAVTVLYNRFPVWEINDLDRDNYPLVIAFEGCPVKKSDRVELACETSGKLAQLFQKIIPAKGTNSKKLTVVFTTVPIDVSANDILAGKIEFIFRNEEEKRRILLKAETGVDECKVLSGLMSLRPAAFTVAGKIKNEVRIPVEDTLIPQFEDAEREALRNKCTGKNVVSEERLKGAELGFELAGHVRALRSGAFCTAFREKWVFDSWREEVVPKSFNSILGCFIARSAGAWDPNRSAVFNLVDEVMADFAKDKSVEKSVMNAFVLLRNHWRSAEQGFKISEIEDPYLQAFAAFLECGATAGKYPRYLKSDKLKCPEFMLALYGAIVGYTSFSRSLLINDNYLPQPLSTDGAGAAMPPIGEAPSIKTIPNCEVNEITCQSGKCLAHAHDHGCTPTRVGKEMKENAPGGGENEPPKEIQPYIPGLDAGRSSKVRRIDNSESMHDVPKFPIETRLNQIRADGEDILVRDQKLCSDIEMKFAGIGPERVRKLVKSVGEFCKEYTQGYYGKKPEAYKQENPDLIDHILRCFMSDKTPNLNFKWKGQEEKRFQAFLEERYHCLRKVHNAKK